MLLDVDVNGAFRLRKEFSDAITIFILPPSIAELRRRLRKRGTETQEQLRVRFENARREMRLYRKFDYVVVNQDLDEAVQDVLSIVRSHHCLTNTLPSEQIRRIIG
jgi:guanylate kinase